MIKIQPYIGENYDKFKILLIGESHYINKNLDEKLFKDWYDPAYHIQFPEHISNQFNTTYQVNQFLNKKTSKLYAIYRFPAQCLGKVFGIPYKEAFTYTLFYNYFQRPNLQKGSFKTIFSDNREDIFAAENLLTILLATWPNLVFFLSKKAYQSYMTYATYARRNAFNVHCLVHPASAWWFKEDGKYGNKKMEKILKDFFKINCNDFLIKIQGL